MVTLARIASRAASPTGRQIIGVKSADVARRWLVICPVIADQYNKMSRCPPDCKVYVGNLGHNGQKDELEREFSYYGRLRNVWVARNPPGFAFVEFEDPRDASDSVKSLDGR